jgi:hypothetical protein
VLRELLEELASALTEAGESDYAADVAALANANNDQINQFLVSNELWGGPGSIADSAGVNSSGRARQRIERALARLGNAQLERGLINPRTEMWVERFQTRSSKWRSILGISTR